MAWQTHRMFSLYFLIPQNKTEFFGQQGWLKQTIWARCKFQSLNSHHHSPLPRVISWKMKILTERGEDQVTVANRSRSGWTQLINEVTLVPGMLIVSLLTFLCMVPCSSEMQTSVDTETLWKVKGREAHTFRSSKSLQMEEPRTCTGQRWWQ